ncbi:MAG: phytochelatin synthase family protein [Pseudomonadota bacterium]
MRIPSSHALLFCAALLAAAGQPPVARESPGDYGAFAPSSLSVDDEVVLLGWNTPGGQKRLQRARHKQDYFQMAHNFQPQANPLYCGIASSVIVLNSMRLPRGSAPSQSEMEVAIPARLGGGRIAYPAYSQQTLLGALTEGVKPREIIEFRNHADEPGKLDPGLTLVQLAGVLETYDTRVEVHPASDSGAASLDRFRATLQSVLDDRHRFVIVNFHGRTMGAPTDGHISPVAAYDELSDSVLLLDVAGYLNPWYWAPVEHLYGAMHTLDGDQYRGYLVVADGT